MGASSDEVISALLDGLLHDEKWVRYESTAALDRLGRTSDEILAALQKAFGDRDSDVSVTAVWALGNLDPRALPALREAMKSDKRHVRWKTEEVLRNVRGSTKERNTRQSTQSVAPAEADRPRR